MGSCKIQDDFFKDSTVFGIAKKGTSLVTIFAPRVEIT